MSDPLTRRLIFAANADGGRFAWIAEAAERIQELEAIVKRLPITADDVTDEMLDRIAHEVGCWPGAWDMVNPQDLVAAIIRVAKAEAEGDVW